MWAIKKHVIIKLTNIINTLTAVHEILMSRKRFSNDNYVRKKFK